MGKYKEQERLGDRSADTEENEEGNVQPKLKSYDGVFKINGRAWLMKNNL